VEVISYGELINRKIDVDARTETPRMTEMKYRKGYYAGVDAVLDLLDAGVTKQRLKQWRDWSLFDWAYRDWCGEIVYPPDKPLTQTEWNERREEILNRDGHACRYCFEVVTHVDHVIPKSKGGTNDPENLVAACAECNYSKGAKHPDDWSWPWFW